jgi:predicted nucleic acid-binding protein
MRHVFIDSSAWIAVLNTNDVRHAQAARLYRELLKDNASFVTTSLILSETQVFLRRRIGYDVAMSFLTSVNESARIKVVFPDLSIERQAKQILRQFADQDFSLTDAISFVVMKEMGILQAFAYDNHFTTAGFELLNQ